MNTNDPLAFITVLRGTDEYVKYIYSCGGCYKFVALMQYVFGRGEAWMNASRDHCAVRIDGLLYDIFGLITETDGWHRFTKEDYQLAQQWSFSAHNLLTLTHCPHCDEPITFPNMEYKVDNKGIIK